MSLDADPPGREERRRVLAALAAVTADPVRLVEAVQDATDDADAARRIAEAFGLDDELAESVLDQQIRHLTPSQRARIADELRVLETPWGPPLDAELRFTSRRNATLTVEGTTQTFRCASSNAVRHQVFSFLHEHVTVPRLRPVVIEEVGVPDASRWVVGPDGSGYRDAP